MIRIHKPTTVPAVLATKGAAETTKMRAEYDAHRKEYRSGAKIFQFDRKLYGDPEVKEALRHAQHGKCAFCESKIAHVMYGDVEHFRPKGGFKRRGELIKPGYYWLTYDWANLLLACQLCNQRYKRNDFPLAGGSRRARSHHADVMKEKPQFVHPAQEDPSAVIGFRDHIAYAVGDAARGRWTIRGLGLNRAALISERERHFTILKTLRDVARGAPPTPERSAALAKLLQAAEADQPYAAMVRAFLLESADLFPNLITTNAPTGSGPSL